MTVVTHRIACFCETTFDAEIPSVADLSHDPEVGELILDGSFMSVTCPACGKRLSPEFPFRLTGVAAVGDIFLVPEADRAAFARGRVDYLNPMPGRVAVGYPELAEKVLIFGLGLDDRVIEIMKYYLLTGPAMAEAPHGGRDVAAFYKGVEADRHVFNIHGMKEGEVGVARLAQEFYSRVASDIDRRLQEEPFCDFCVAPWVSLKRMAGQQE